MGYFLLILVSIVWGFSFGLIKNSLAGIDANLISFIRIFISCLVFLPFIRLRGVNRKILPNLVLTGVLQFGLMYIAYNYSFNYLKAYEVALFTIFTPLYVTLLNDLFQRHFSWTNLITALVAILGTGVIEGKAVFNSGILLGFVIVQLSNICYAFGQIYYKKVMASEGGITDQQIFAFLYMGGAGITLLSSLVFVDFSKVAITTNQWLILAYLGAIASGLCFFLWNKGARMVDTGSLAIFNNLKVPLSVAISLLVFGEQTNLINLILGGAIILAALALNKVFGRKAKNPGMST
jgi:carboxylate/amino acid/amine transporter